MRDRGSLPGAKTAEWAAVAAKLKLFGAALLDGDGFWYGLVPLKAFVEGRNLGREDAGIQIRPVMQERWAAIFFDHTQLQVLHRARAKTVKSAAGVSMNTPKT